MQLLPFSFGEFSWGHKTKLTRGTGIAAEAWGQAEFSWVHKTTKLTTQEVQVLRQKHEGNQRLVERAVSECTSLSTRCNKLQRDKSTLSASIQRLTDTLSQSISSTAAGDAQVSYVHARTHTHTHTTCDETCTWRGVFSQELPLFFLSAGAQQYEETQWLVQSAPVQTRQVLST
jgi:hypothetical protein